MKLTKIKVALFSILGTLTMIIGAILVYLKFKNGDSIVNKGKAFKIKPHKKETETLPASPNLDKTLDDIENDIIN